MERRVRRAAVLICPVISHSLPSYTAFAADIVAKYYARHDLVLFLAYGPMTNYYQALVELTISNLRAMVSC
jgi:hypothetical protein